MSTETLTAPVEVVTPIGPREALRLGRLVRPEKCTGNWFQGETAACALGAMHVGWFGDSPLNRQTFDDRTIDRLGGHWVSVYVRFDRAEVMNEDGDAAVDAYLAGLGL